MTNLGFKLKDSFVDKYKNVEPDFGFNGLGKIAYLRTYSRLKTDGTNERWFETARRVVEGTYTIQKEHIEKYGLGWSDRKGQASAEEMYDRLFKMKFLPAGRGLWGMGTNLVHKKKLYAALASCAFYSTKDIDKEPTRPFEFMMDMSMLGVGVGFDTKGEGKLTIKEPKGMFNYTIPDTREGWVESLKLLLDAYLKGLALPTFDYSVIRPFGSIISTFGGTASGPDPLRDLHEDVQKRLKEKTGKKISITDIVDIMNWIGRCVVAGNVRRTAQISLGPNDNEEYLSLKDYQWNGTEYVGPKAHRASYGWTSNNSILAETGMDYSKIAKQISTNGEPGLIWLKNAQDYGRMIDPPNFKDKRAEGTNPCGEQTLESGELCCLVETFITRADSLEDYKRTLKFAYLYAKTVTLGNTHWFETNRVMLRNRRIGTSVSGIAQFVDKRGLEELKTWLDQGYNTIQYYDEVYSDWLAIPHSIKTTSIKPSGTVSLLAGVTPGVHYPESEYYIRRIRLKKDSDLIAPLEDAGYLVESDTTDPSSLVVEIPVHIEGVRTNRQVGIWEKVSLAAFIQRYWADNQVSCTVSFSEHERTEIANVLNYHQYGLKGISFLPILEQTKYSQMPYEEISKEQYEATVKKLKKIKLRGDIAVDATPELYCDGDSCMLK